MEAGSKDNERLVENLIQIYACKEPTENFFFLLVICLAYSLTLTME
jgi:hypothetical protein